MKIPDYLNLGKLGPIHWLVVTASLLLTLGAWHISSREAEERRRLQFEFQANQIVALTIERMEKYEEALWAGVAAIQSHGHDIDVNVWKEFSATLSIENRFPGINGIGVVHRVTPDDLKDYLEKEREHRPDYHIHPGHDQDAFWPVTYVEPVEINRQAVGLDMAHEGRRFEAALKARDSGQTQATAPIVLVQDEERTPGFLLYAPYFREGNIHTETERRKRFEGMVYAPFIMHKLMRGTLENRNRLVNFRIFDETDPLYDELSSDSADFDDDPLFQTEITTPMYGRTWVFAVQTTELFRQRYSTLQPTFILVGGIVIEGMLVCLFLILGHSGQRADKLAETITKDLKDSETKLQTTIDQMMEGLITINPRGTVLSFSKTAERIFEYTPEEVIGQTVNRLMPEPFKSEHDEYVARYLRTGEKKLIGKRRIVKATKKSGEVFPIELAVNEATSHGERYFIGTVRDLSEKARAEETMAQQQALLDAAVHASSSGFAMVNRVGQLIEVNEALASWLGYTRDDLIGMHFAQFLPREKSDPLMHQMEGLLVGDNQNLLQETPFKRQDGHLVWGLLSAAQVRDSQDQTLCAVCHFMDIQVEKALQEELRHRNKELMQTNRDLKKSNEDLDQFAYIASHDLKAPLNAIHKIVGWLEEDCAGILPEDSTEHLGLLRSRSQRMMKLLDDLLMYSRVGRANYSTVSFNLHEMVEDLAHLMGVSESFTLRSPEVDLVLPRTPFELMLRNLISNAIKHHDKKQGRIDVQYRSQDGNHVITVADDGPGIPPALQEKALEMFQTLKPRDQVEGSGMGLAITQKIVRHFGGELTIQSDGVRGTNMIVRWPKIAEENPVGNVSIPTEQAS